MDKPDAAPAWDRGRDPPPVAAKPGAAAAAPNTHPHNLSKKKIFKVIYTFLHLR